MGAPETRSRTHANHFFMLCTGIDLIEIPRIQRAIERWGERFLRRVFTSNELADCGFTRRMAALDSPEAVGNYASLAVRWAAKEAAAKALGVGLRGLSGQRVASLSQETAPEGVAWTEIEVLRGTRGRPVLRLHGAAARLATDLGIRELAVSLAHTHAYAVASVVGLTQEDE